MLEISFDLLFIAFVIIIIHNGLPQRTLPDCKLKCLCSARETICPCPPVNRRLTHPFLSPRDVLQDWIPFHFTPSLPFPLYSAFQLYFLIASFSLTLQKNLAPRPQQVGYFEAQACHLPSQLAPWIKCLPCLNILLVFIGPSWGKFYQVQAW